MPRGITVIGSELASVEMSTDSGQNFFTLPNVQSHVESGGDLNQRQIKTFEGAASRTGLPDVSSVAITAVHLPHHAAWRAIDTAATDGALVTLRVRTNDEEWFAVTGSMRYSRTIDETTGEVTFVGTVPNFTTSEFAPGMTLEFAMTCQHLVSQKASSSTQYRRLEK